jgi:hypothetical protein
LTRHNQEENKSKTNKMRKERKKKKKKAKYRTYRIGDVQHGKRQLAVVIPNTQNWKKIEQNIGYPTFDKYEGLEWVCVSVWERERKKEREREMGTYRTGSLLW